MDISCHDQHFGAREDGGRRGGGVSRRRGDGGESAGATWQEVSSVVSKIKDV